MTPPASVRPLAMQEVQGNPLAMAPLIATPPPPPRTDPVEQFLGRPAGPYRRLAPNPSALPTRGSLEGLARAGSWKAVASGAQSLLVSSRGGQPGALALDEQLGVRFLRIAALVKLRQVPTAEREMTLLGDLTGRAWLYESHAGPAALKRHGSMAPFELLHLHALMPSYSGNHPASIGRLLALVQVIRRRAWPEAAAEASDADAVAGAEVPVVAAEEEARAVGQRRALHLSLVNEYGACADYPLAVAHLERLIEAEPAEGATPSGRVGGVGGKAQLLSLLGRLLLQAGNMEAAEDVRSAASSKGFALTWYRALTWYFLHVSSPRTNFEPWKAVGTRGRGSLTAR